MAAVLTWCIIVIGISVIVNSLFSLVERLKGLERRLAIMYQLTRRMAAQLGIPEAPLDAELRAMCGRSERAQAIKRAREELGLGLKDATEYVDSL